MPEPFRIAHLSDLHLTKTDGARRSQPNVFTALKGMNKAFRKIVSSDSLQKAELDKAVKGLKLGSQQTQFPIVINPDPRVVIFGLNSNNLGNFDGLTNALGHIDYFQLSSLASKLHKYRDIPVKIIALHHSPNIPGKETSIRRGQRPYSSFERLAQQIPAGQRHGLRLLGITHRVRLIVHGHLHVDEDRRVGGIRVIGAPASTQPVSDKKKPGQYQIYTYSIFGSGKRVRVNKTYIKG